MQALALEPIRTSTEDLMPVVGFATRGVSIRTLIDRMEGKRLPLYVAVDVALSMARLIHAEHSAGRTLGALDASRVALMENGAISLVAGGQRLAPELKKGSAQPTVASDVFALGTVMMQLFTGVDDPSRNSNVDVPEELIQLAQSCSDRDPKMRPSSMKHVEKALAVQLSEQQMEEALERRVALVKQFAPEMPQVRVPRQERVIATEDITGHNLVGLRRGGTGVAKVMIAMAVLLLLSAAGVWWLQYGRVQPAVTPPPAPAAEVAAPEDTHAAIVAPAEPSAPAEVEPAAPPAPVEVKAAPVKAKKHKKR
jgi:hypothetical protein